MSDTALTVEILSQIKAAVERILRRFQPVDSVDFFLNSESGLEKLDAICMQLIAIGESLKNLDKVAGVELLQAYPEVDWRSAKGMRDIITHHYFDLDAEAVFNVCKTDLPEIIPVLERIIGDIKNDPLAPGNCEM